MCSRYLLSGPRDKNVPIMNSCSLYCKFCGQGICMRCSPLYFDELEQKCTFDPQNEEKKDNIPMRGKNVSTHTRSSYKCMNCLYKYNKKVCQSVSHFICTFSRFLSYILL